MVSNVFQRMKEKSLSKRKDIVNREVEFCQLNSLKSCLVFWVAGTNQIEGVKLLEQKLVNVDIDKLCFQPHKTIVDDDNATVLQYKDLKFGGKIRNNKLMTLLDQKHDILLDLSQEANVLSNYVLEHSTAHCKIGMKKEGFEADIIVDNTSDAINFVESAVNLLSKIKKY